MRNLSALFIILCLGTYTSSFAQNWESLDSGTDYILFDMSIPPGQSEVIYAAGMQYTWDAEGIIIKSIDGGDTWQQIVGGPGTIGFEAICFTSVDTGYVAGWDAYIAKTTDGGTTWVELNTGGDDWFLMDIEFFDVDHGLALANLNSGASGVYVTADAGENWTLASGINQNVQDLAYADANTVYAVGGDEKISKSTNGGNSFTEIYSGQFQRYFMGCDFDKDFGVVGGEDGKIMSTTDAGANWSTFATGYHNFQGVHVFDADSAYIGGTDEDVYKTTDWGANWVMEFNGLGQSHIYKVKFADDGTGFLCGSQGLMKRKTAPVIPLMADFTADETDICDANEVSFTDLSTGDVETWSWTFEGGYPSDSQEPNPSIFYLDAGTYDVSLTVTDADGESSIIMEDYITVHNCTGVDGENNYSFNLIPNPAQDLIHISGINDESTLVQIYDIQARFIMETMTKGQQLDVSNLQTGVYFIQFKNSNQEDVKKKLIIK